MRHVSSGLLLGQLLTIIYIVIKLKWLTPLLFWQLFVNRYPHVHNDSLMWFTDWQSCNVNMSIVALITQDNYYRIQTCMQWKYVNNSWLFV